jgi:hypothetical protein
MLPIKDVRDAVLHYLERKAAFRRGVASKIAERETAVQIAKNARYAESIEKIVQYVKGLPDTAPGLMKLAECQELYNQEGDFVDIPDHYEINATAIHLGPRGSVVDDAEMENVFNNWVRDVISELKNPSFRFGQ